MLTVITCLVFYIGSALMIFPGMKKRKTKAEVLLAKNESNFVKGVAALMVFLAHSQDFLLQNNFSGSAVLKPLSVLGGVGVLLFFFLSGYGIFKGYADKVPTIRYWRNRIVNVFIPAMVISACSRVAICLTCRENIEVLPFIRDVFYHQWYVDVVMLEYIVFFISWILAKNNKIKLLIYTLIGSCVIGLVFLHMGLNARWYNGVLLFPAGMTLAFGEDKIVSLCKRAKVILLILSGIGFGLTGIGFSLLKGMFVGDLLKSLSGVYLALLLVMFVDVIQVGNKAVNWVGEKSLYVYLCHIYVLELISRIVQERGTFGIKIELWFYIILILSVLYAGVMSIVFKKRSKL